MADKDVDAMISALAPYIDSWHCADLDVARAMSAAELQQRVQSLHEANSAKEKTHSAVAQKQKTRSAS